VPLFNSEIRKIFSEFVIPAKAGIQNCFAEKAGCPPPLHEGRLYAGMTVKLPDPPF